MPGHVRERMPAPRVCAARGSIEPSFEQRAVSVGAAVAEERPVAANLFDTAEIAFHHQRLLLVDGGLRDYLAEGIADKGRAPEFDQAVFRSFEADAVHRGDENAVG